MFLCTTYKTTKATGVGLWSLLYRITSLSVTYIPCHLHYSLLASKVGGLPGLQLRSLLWRRLGSSSRLLAVWVGFCSIVIGHIWYLTRHWYCREYGIIAEFILAVGNINKNWFAAFGVVLHVGSLLFLLRYWALFPPVIFHFLLPSNEMGMEMTCW